jgi:superfamily II DNA or RNA helicase
MRGLWFSVKLLTQSVSLNLNWNEQVASIVIDSTISSAHRQKILSGWGKDFYILLSVHTLEIGYDVPEVGVEIILATTSNMNQVIQRIGRIVRNTKERRRL